MRRSVLILFALLLCIGAAACGQKGPLKLPPDAPKTQAAAGAS
jgi:predicted small lipoprotein YifL